MPNSREALLSQRVSAQDIERLQKLVDKANCCVERYGLEGERLPSTTFRAAAVNPVDSFTSRREEVLRESTKVT